MQRIYIFKRFERFWHWAQALLIIFMLLTGFEIHGVYTLFGFHDAVALHTVAAWTLIGLWVFAIFWHFTTGEWKQYVPTLEKVDAVVTTLVAQSQGESCAARVPVEAPSRDTPAGSVTTRYTGRLLSAAARFGLTIQTAGNGFGGRRVSNSACAA